MNFFGGDDRAELTPQEECVQSLADKVSEYVTFFKGAYLGNIKAIIRGLEDNQDPNAKDPTTGNTAFIQATKSGHTYIVQLLGKTKGVRIDAHGFGGMTALHHAAKNNRLEMIKFLLDECKANIDSEDDGGNTALFHAATNGNLKAADLLLQRGAQGNHINKASITPFISAVINSRTAVIDSLIKKNIDIDACDANGNSALHIAAMCGYDRAVKQLLFAHAKIDAENHEGKTPAEVASTEGVRNMIESYSDLDM